MKQLIRLFQYLQTCKIIIKIIPPKILNVSAKACGDKPVDDKPETLINKESK